MNIVKNNNKYIFYNEIEILKDLPNNTFYLCNDSRTAECWLEISKQFELPKKLYDGGDNNFRSLVLNSFHKSDFNTGVLLEGYKGQGKSITAKLLCLESKLPIIVIKDPISKNVDFGTFINSIHAPVVILLDEFEKIFKSYNYNRNDDKKDFHTQETFLTLMDGVLNSEHKRLFIFTSNDSIDDTFMNRPSRIKFHKIYNYISEQLYHEIIDDLLINKEFKKDLTDNISIQDATIDILISIINDINLINKPFSYFKKYYNYKPRTTKYELSYFNNDEYILLGNILLEKELTRTTRYIDGLYLKNIITSNNDETVFSADACHNLMYKIYTETECEDLEKNTILYRLTKKG